MGTASVPDPFGNIKMIDYQVFVDRRGLLYDDFIANIEFVFCVEEEPVCCQSCHCFCLHCTAQKTWEASVGELEIISKFYIFSMFFKFCKLNLCSQIRNCRIPQIIEPCPPCPSDPLEMPNRLSMECCHQNVWIKELKNGVSNQNFNVFMPFVSFQ